MIYGIRWDKRSDKSGFYKYLQSFRVSKNVWPSKSFSQLCLAIFGEQIDFFSLSTLQSEKSSKSISFFVVQTQLILAYFYYGNNVDTINFENSSNFWDYFVFYWYPFPSTKNTHKSMIWMFRPAISLIMHNRNYFQASKI